MPQQRGFQLLLTRLPRTLRGNLLALHILYTMHFSFAIVLAVVAALASSTSAAPIDDDQAICPLRCRYKGVCVVCEVTLQSFTPRMGYK
ncbi:hypothetical protein EDD22DRAFT_916887, partial [Suillus occidentalis]